MVTGDELTRFVREEEEMADFFLHHLGAVTRQYLKARSAA
jgi:hypothetical protein